MLGEDDREDLPRDQGVEERAHCIVGGLPHRVGAFRVGVPSMCLEDPNLPRRHVNSSRHWLKFGGCISREKEICVRTLIVESAEASVVGDEGGGGFFGVVPMAGRVERIG